MSGTDRGRPRTRSTAGDTSPKSTASLNNPKTIESALIDSESKLAAAALDSNKDEQAEIEDLRSKYEFIKTRSLFVPPQTKKESLENFQKDQDQDITYGDENE